MKDANINHVRMERIIELQKLLRQKKPLNCRSFALHWQKKFGYAKHLSRKTILRDIEWLIDSAHAPIEYDASRKVYYLSSDTWEFPLLQLQEGEYISLLLARQMARLYRNTPIAGDLDAFFEKLRVSMTNKINVDPVLYDNIISFHGKFPQIIDPKVWKAVLKGLQTGCTLKFLYHSPHGESPSMREVGPVHLANMDDDWYLLGLSGDTSPDSWRQFSLARMSNVKVSTTPFDLPEGFTPDALFGSRFSKAIAFPGQDVFTVRLRFSPSVAHFVLERVWHPEQKLKQEKGGSILLTLPMPSLLEAKAFCLYWGAAVQVISPPELRSAVIDEARKIVASAK